MIAILIVFCLAAILLLFGMIGDKDANNRRNYTYGFCTLVAAIVLILIKFM